MEDVETEDVKMLVMMVRGRLVETKMEDIKM